MRKYTAKGTRTRVKSHGGGAVGRFYRGLSKKRKLLFIGICSVFAVSIGLGVFMAVKPEAPAVVSAVDVTSSDIQQTITVSGTVSSSNQSFFKAVDGVAVKEVLVGLGDSVQAGQALASFDVTGLSQKVEEKQQAYIQSKKTYEDSIQQAEKARQQLPELEAQIAALEAQAAGGSGETDGGSPSIKDILGNFSLDTITQLLSSLTSGFDIASLMGGGQYSDSEMQLIELQAKKIVLESQANNTMLSVYKSLTDSTLKAYEEYKTAVDSLSAGWTAAEAGVVTKLKLTAGQSFSVSGAAEAMDISQVLSLLQSGVSADSLLSGLSGSDIADGLVIDNYSGFSIDFNINQYDISKVSVGQTVSISAVNNPVSYAGKVSYISPTMSDSSMSFDIGSIASSLTGGGASGGLDAAVTVDNPDKSMIIGMSVDMDINTSFVAGAVAVPIEAIYLEGSDVYVFVIEDGRVYKRQLEVGISSNTMYQVISGCKQGDKLVKNPLSSLEDGARVKIKVD